MSIDCLCYWWGLTVNNRLLVAKSVGGTPKLYKHFQLAGVKGWGDWVMLVLQIPCCSRVNCVYTYTNSFNLRKRETNMSITCSSCKWSIFEVCMVYIKTLNDPFQSPFSYANGANIKQVGDIKNAMGEIHSSINLVLQGTARKIQEFILYFLKKWLSTGIH